MPINSASGTPLPGKLNVRVAASNTCRQRETALVVTEPVAFTIPVHH